MITILEHTIEETIIDKNGWILDLGCVNFLFSNEIKKFCNNVICVDPNPNIVNIPEGFFYEKMAVVFDENINEIKKQYNLNKPNEKSKFRKDKYKILIEINKYLHKIIDFETILSDRESDLFTEEQINNIEIKLADFGSIQYEQNLKNEN